MKKISKSHSIPVMDKEISSFLKCIPHNGVILDIGGCWGWHWRNVHIIRPDVSVVILDFVRPNLMHAKTLLGDLINKNICLIHGDATNLQFSSELFDGIWTVQCLQHIENFDSAIFELYKVMKPGAIFANYSLNIQPQVRFLKKLLRKTYVTNGYMMDGQLWLSRASAKQKLHLEKIFQNIVDERWSEYLFSPALGLDSPGKENHWLGRLDAKLTNNNGFMRWFARQHSFHVIKK
ncbi:MAG: SAM-dependent methyltransferase [Gammaproteobacteria bacterium]|nr:SAM-dependent methyltransferase [Gammaproteobacteria bacterium]